jgi:predicted NBD/HSP70 family sugar kinase
MSFNTQHDDDELELPVEAVAERLGLPASMLIRRIEAGDIPARQVRDVDGFHYRVRIAELGSMLPDDGEEAQEITGTPTPLIRNGHAPHAAAPPDAPHDDAAAQIADDDVLALAGDDAEAIPPPPVRGTVELAPVEAGEGPRAELAMMNLDPRELVAGLLDRWERTLEQRIYAEQRQRFEAELTNRQAKVKQLQLELEAARAEHAAALAEKERLLAEKMRELVERERDLHEARTQQRRGWLFRR